MASPATANHPPDAFPYDAGPTRLAHAIDQAPGGFLPTPERVETVSALLPVRGRRPIASTPLVAPPPDARGRLRLREFAVSTVSLDPEEAVTFLSFLPPPDGVRQTVVDGVVAAPDLRFWQQAMRFATELVVRQRYMPGLTETDGKFEARWTSVLLEGDAARAMRLARSMPPACRALEDPPPAPLDALRLFLDHTIDHLVRSAFLHTPDPPAPPATPGQAQAVLAERRWIAALSSGEARPGGEPAELERLRRRIDGWRRLLEVASDSPVRLCFRLEEPGSPTDGLWCLEPLVQNVADPSLMVPLEEGRIGSEFLLASLGQAGRISASVAALLEAGGGPVEFGRERAYAFLSGEAATLRRAGYGVLLPAWWGKGDAAPRLRARVTPQEATAPSSGGFSLQALVDVEWDVVLAGERLSRQELEALAALKVPLVHVRGQWVEVDPAVLERLLDRMRRSSEMTAAEALRMALEAGPGESGDEGRQLAEVRAEGWIDELLRQLLGSGAFEEVEQPRGLRGSLRPYQVRGLSWLTFLQRWGLGACLADDMGLGKTIQTLALVQREWEAGERRPVLLVCPTSVLGNWRDEAARFVPDLPVLLHHGSDRGRGDALAESASRHALLLTSYGILYRDRDDLADVEWAGMVLDEAQNIKNPDALQSRAARAVPAAYRVALTGTPVENHVGDLWAIMEFLNPGLLGSRRAFRRSFLLPIQTDRDPRATERLRRLTGPFVLRRVKTDPRVAPELPAKVETRAYCTLTAEQASLYRAVLRDLEEELDSAAGMARKGLILSVLLRLKQICNHPAHFLGDGSRIPRRSGKLRRLTELLGEVMEEGERALVFTQFVEMGRILQSHLEATFGREVLFLHGGVSRAARDRMVKRFQDEASPDRPAVFILSLKAGGTGLNLTAANHVFHFDRWWNPAVEDQATDRAFRIGQGRSVQVHKFVCSGTLEERIDRMIETKKDTARAVVGTGEAWLTELDDEELRAVLALSGDSLGTADEDD